MEHLSHYNQQYILFYNIYINFQFFSAISDSKFQIQMNKTDQTTGKDPENQPVSTLPAYPQIRGNKTSLGGPITVSREKTKIGLEVQRRNFEGSGTRVKGVDKNDQQAYLTDTTSLTQVNVNNGVGQRNQGRLREGLNEIDTGNFAAKPIQSQHQTLNSFKNQKIHQESLETSKLDSTGQNLHLKMSQTVSGMQQDSIVNTTTEQTRGLFEKIVSTVEEKQSEIDHEQNAGKKSVASNKLPKAERSVYSKRPLSSNHRSSKSRDIDGWGTKPAESSNMSTLVTGHQMVRKAKYAHRMTSSRSGTVRNELPSYQGDIQKAKDDHSSQAPNQLDLMKNRGIMLSNNMPSKLKQKTKSKNSSQGKYVSSAGRRHGDLNLQRNSIENAGSDKYIQTGGQTYFFSGAGLPTEESIPSLKNRGAIMKAPKNTKPIINSDYDTGSQTTLLAKHFNALGEKDIGGIFSKKQGQSGFKLKHNGVYGPRNNTSESHNSVTSPNTSIDFKQDGHVVKRFKKKDSQKSGMRNKSGKTFDSLHSNCNHLKRSKVINDGSKPNLYENKRGSEQSSSGRYKRMRNQYHSITESRPDLYDNSMAWRQIGSQSALNKHQDQTRNQLNHYKSSLNPLRNIQSIQNLPMLQSSQSKQFIDDQHKLPQKMKNRYSGTHFSANKTFLSAIESSQGRTDGEETVTTSQNINQPGLIQKGKNASDGLNQKKILQQNGTFDDGQMQKGLVKTDDNQQLTVLSVKEKSVVQKKKGDKSLSAQKLIDIKSTKDRQSQSGYLAAPTGQTLSNQLQNEDPYQDKNFPAQGESLKNGDGRSSAHFNKIKSNGALLQSTKARSSVLDRNQQYHSVSNSMDTSNLAHKNQMSGPALKSDGLGGYYKNQYSSGHFATIDMAEFDQKKSNKMPRTQSLKDRVDPESQHYNRGNQHYFPQMTNGGQNLNQSFETINFDREKRQIEGVRQSLPNPILKPSSKLPRIERTTGDERVNRASFMYDDSYSNKRIFGNETQKQQQQVKFKKNYSNLSIPKSLSKIQKRRMALDSDFMLYYKSVKMDQRIYGDNLERVNNNQYSDEYPYHLYEHNPNKQTIAFAEQLPNNVQNDQIKQLHNSNPYKVKELEGRNLNESNMVDNFESSKFENSRDEETSQKSTEKKNFDEIKPLNSIVEPIVEKETERRGSAITSIKSDKMMNEGEGANSTSAVNGNQLKFSMGSYPNKTAYTAVADVDEQLPRDSIQAKRLTQTQQELKDKIQNCLKSSKGLQNYYKSDKQLKDSNEQLEDFEDYHRITATDIVKKQPSLLDTPAMSFSISNQKQIQNSGGSKTVMATSQPLAVIEIQPRNNQLNSRIISEKFKSDVFTDSTAQMQAKNMQLYIEEQPYENKQSSFKIDSEQIIQSDLISNPNMNLKKTTPMQYSQMNVDQLVPNQQIHLVASKTEANKMRLSAQKREALISMHEAPSDTLTYSIKETSADKLPNILKERSWKQDAVKSYLDSNKQVFDPNAKQQLDDSEKHQDIITVYDESQLEKAQFDLANSTESNVVYSGNLKYETQVNPNSKIQSQSSIGIVQYEANKMDELKNTTGADDELPGGIIDVKDEEEEEESSEDQNQQKSPAEIDHFEQPANTFQATIKSNRTTSTAYIADQIDKINVEWDILQRAQQNIIQEKEMITKQMKDLQRHKDKMNKKREIEEQKMKLDQQRQEITQEMVQLEKLKQQLMQMHDNVNVNQQESPSVQYGMEKTGKEIQSKQKGQRASMKNQKYDDTIQTKNQVSQGYIHTFGQNQQHLVQEMIILPNTSNPGIQKAMPKQLTIERPVHTRNDSRQNRPFNSYTNQLSQGKKTTQFQDQKTAAGTILETVNDYSDSQEASISALNKQRASNTNANTSNILNISQNSAELYDNQNRDHQDQVQALENTDDVDEFTFNDIDQFRGFDQKIGRKTVGGQLSKNMRDPAPATYTNSTTHYARDTVIDQETGQDDQHEDEEEFDEEESQISHLSLNINYLAGMKVPGNLGQMFDWAESPLMNDVHVNQYKFVVIEETTGKQSERFLSENQILLMLKQVMQDPAELGTTINIKKTFKVALQTLAELMGILGQQQAFPAVLEKYQKISGENTIKLLIQCRQLILTRRLVFQTLRHLTKFLKTVARIRFEVDLYLQESEDGSRTNTHQSELYHRLKHRAAELLPQLAKQVLANIEILRSKHRLFENLLGMTHRGNQIKNVMIFKKVDAEKLVFKEYNSMMAITKAVGITIGPLINKVVDN